MPGTYEWTWGTGPNQNVTLIEALGAAPTPLPAALPLFASGICGLGLGLLGWRRKRKVQAV